MRRISNEKLIMLEWLHTPKHERKFKYTQSQNDRYGMYWAEQGNKLRRKARRIQTSGRIKRIFTRWHRRFCRPTGGKNTGRFIHSAQPVTNMPMI